MDGVLASLDVDLLMADIDVDSLLLARLRRDDISSDPFPAAHGSIFARDRSKGVVRGANRTIWLRDDDDGVIYGRIQS